MNEQRGGYTTQEVYDALVSIAPAMQRAWEMADTDEMGRERARRQGWVRTWLLRRSLRSQQGKWKARE